MKPYLHVNALMIITHRKSIEQKGGTEKILHADYNFCGCYRQTGSQHYIRL